MIPPAEQGADPIGGHFSADFYEDDDRWWRARCNCGWEAPSIYPAAEDAADVLMDHAYEQGRLAAAREAGT